MLRRNRIRALRMAFLPTLCLSALYLPFFTHAAVQPAFDRPDQPFRLAPMAESARSVILPLATNLHLAFDQELLRVHTIWQGPPLNLYGPPYSNAKQPFLATYDGTVFLQNPPLFPWSTSTNLPPVHQAPDGARFRSINTARRPVTLQFDIRAPNETGTARVQLSPRIEPLQDSLAVILRFHISASESPLYHLAHATMDSANLITPRTVLLPREDHVLLLAVRSDSGTASWQLVRQSVDYHENVITEKGTEEDWETRHVQGTQSRLFLRIPPSRESSIVEFCVARAENRSQALDWADQLLASSPNPSPKSEAPNPKQAGEGAKSISQSQPRDEPSDSPPIFSPDPGFPDRRTGDSSYAIEHFPVPPEIDLLVTGMDWLPGGNLAVCTWVGEIYIVENAQGSVSEARYRRFAEGLNEPLGLQVIEGEIFVTQKMELTRVVDTNNNGRADLYQTINNDWGYSGNYHSYAFGPVQPPDKSFFVFLTGQRSRWDLPYGGWALRISSDGESVEPFAHGLRVPNGFGLYGPDNDLFVVDNQGNWVGACKLNHLKKGAFYGFPSAWPAPKKKPHDSFHPPAVWFPRSLAPSASDFAVIRDHRFGPFKNQMLVGDFQNATVTRVMLEKVAGEWQGAVWPFAKGFLSGVNRLTYGPDGKLYVGGVKRTWSSASPQEYSLDRVVFTGDDPFSMTDVRARHYGFDLHFSQPVDPETARDPLSYLVEQFTYRYHSAYGSPEIDHTGKANSATEIQIAQVILSNDRTQLQLHLKDAKPGYVTSIRAYDITNDQGEFLRQDTCYYTLNHLPAPAN